MINDRNPFGITPVRIAKPGKAMFRREAQLWMGSCFVENLGKKMREREYPVALNPFGVVFHPLILARLLRADETDLMAACVERDGVWLNFLLGAPFAAPSRKQLEQQIREAIQNLHFQIKQVDWLVVTFGTAFVYEHHTFGRVGKCHRFPQSEFEKKLSRPEEMADYWLETLDFLRELNPALKVLATVSPVRHSRDGLVENSRSKASLLCMIQLLEEKAQQFWYFPAFELVMDELRDYRFFGSDLVHPNEEAISYLWDRFSETCFPEEEQETNRLFDEWRILQQHKPVIGFGPSFEAWQKQKKEREDQLHERLNREERK